LGKKKINESNDKTEKKITDFNIKSNKIENNNHSDSETSQCSKKKNQKIRNKKNNKKNNNENINKNKKSSIKLKEKEEEDSKKILLKKVSTSPKYYKNYENTNSPSDFMKYNFNFSNTEQYLNGKIINDSNKQCVNNNELKKNYLFIDKKIPEENFNNDIPKLIWSFQQSKCDNLKECLLIIEKNWPRKIYDYNEELALKIFTFLNYNFDETIKFISSDEFRNYCKNLRIKKSDNKLL